MTHSMKVHWQAVITRLKTTGWQQGLVGERNGPNCLIGAIELEISDYETQCNMFWRLRKVIGNRIARWNDHPDRTKEEVLGVLAKLRDGDK